MNARHFDHLLERWHVLASGLPDRRTGENSFYSMADIALAAFALFFIQCPSFLSFQQNMDKAHGRNNARSLFGIERIPCDNHIRQTLAGQGKKHLSRLLLTMKLLPFSLHTLLEVTDPSYQMVRTAAGARQKFFQHLEAVTAYWFFENWERLMNFMMRGQEVDPYAARKS